MMMECLELLNVCVCVCVGWGEGDWWWVVSEGLIVIGGVLLDVRVMSGGGWCGESVCGRRSKGLES